MGSDIFCVGKGEVTAKWLNPKVRPPPNVRPLLGPRTSRNESKTPGLTFRGGGVTDSALLQVFHEEPLNFLPTPERGIQFKGDGLSSQGNFSVVQADVEFPECGDLRKVLVEEFQQSVFTRKKFGEVDNTKRGPEHVAFVHLELVGDPKPHSAKAIRTVGVREQVLYEVVQGFLKQGNALAVQIGCQGHF